jgi:hypothetical protein
MVQERELSELRRVWELKGNRPCDHPSKDKEYMLSSQTGDWACLVCGECPVVR